MSNRNYIYASIFARIDVIWPEETMRFRGGRSYWQNWVPEDGMEGVVRGIFCINLHR